MKNWKETFEKSNIKGSILKPTNKGLMYISTPEEILDEISNLKKNQIITTKELAQILAKKHSADYTCGLTTGIFLAIVANYIEQQRLDLPYWRVVKDKGELYESYLRELSHQKERLENEGFEILQKGKKYFVKF